ncbi:MAG: thiolase family protein [Pseudomonadales bacterium]|nr:thiolase family protein [Pseudomonadales bacterium]
MREVVIVDSVRTGLAKSFRGSFNMTRPDEMVAHCIDSLLERNPALNPELVEDCLVGAAAQDGYQGGNIGRAATFLSKLPISTAGITMNRFCSSGLQTIAFAANQIASGCADVIVAGGVESITLTTGKSNNEGTANPRLQEEVPGLYMPMGVTAEVVAKRYGVSREAQDEYSLQSQQRIAAAQEAGLFADEIAPMTVKFQKVVNKETKETAIVETVVDRDECNRPSTTLEGLSGLKPVFDPENGTVTAGNASQLSDGASMTLVMSAEKAEELGLNPKAYFRGFLATGCGPDEMGIGPVVAIPKLLDYKGMKIDDIDLWELNEAFASQTVYCRDKLNIDNEKYNTSGGSISIGHPFGMSGSRMTGHLVRELQRRNQKWGIVSMCVAGGMGAAGLFEAC